MEINNKSREEICDSYHTLREDIRHYLSAKLSDTDEEHPLDVYISLGFGIVGMSSLEMPTITSIFQELKEGIIWFQYEGSENYVEFDDMFTEDLISIVREI